MKRLLTNYHGIIAKYLIFRTDRIGDFITSQVVSYSLKHKSKNNQIDFIIGIGDNDIRKKITT